MTTYLSSWLPWGGNTPPPAPPPPAIPPPPPPPPPRDASTPAAAPSMSETKRLLRQLSLPILGGTFLLTSMRLTRRSTIQRRLAMVPPYYHPNNAAPINPPSGALDAVEALQLATMNVFSVAMLLVGGGAFAMDISTLDELRAKFKSTEVGEEWEKQQKAAEEEFEEWIVGVLARKDLKEKVKEEVEKELAKKG